MKFLFKISTFFLTLASCMFFSLSLNAQIYQLSGEGFEENLGITITPEHPGAFEETTVTVQNYSTDLGRAEIIWYVDGSLKKKGIGEKSLTFTTKNLGNASRIEITALSTDGRTITDSAVIIPASVDIIWQAESYVPPFYKGRALYTGEGKITFVAIPELIKSNGGKFDPKTLFYTWKKDRKKLLDSGYGKDSITIDAPLIPEPLFIEAEVSSLDESVTAAEGIILSPEDPQIIFYEDSPLLGIFYEKALSGKFTLPAKEVVITAVPYFYSAGDRKKDITYTWSQNGTLVEKENKESIILRKENDEKGEALLEVALKNKEKLFQFGSNALSIVFGEESAKALFQ